MVRNGKLKYNNDEGIFASSFSDHSVSQNMMDLIFIGLLCLMLGGSSELLCAKAVLHLDIFILSVYFAPIVVVFLNYVRYVLFVFFGKVYKNIFVSAFVYLEH